MMVNNFRETAVLYKKRKKNGETNMGGKTRRYSIIIVLLGENGQKIKKEEL